MSRSINSLVSKKATNREVLFNGRLATFVNPPTHSGDLYVTRDLYVNGTIYPMKYSAGQVIKTFMFNNTQLNQTDRDIIGGPISIFTFSYTPTSANSYLLVEYQTIYSFGDSATGGDTMSARMYVSGDEISSTYQRWLNEIGGGTRSGTIFPIVGRYTNSSTSAKIIRVDVTSTVDDTITVRGNNSTWLKITEVGR